ncbi:lipid phosphate phosphatase 1 [Ceratobasidium sp. AG-Ba]|nr:lipid phosphate phosphatase 1 [Ceratobasidium sp. AG-Ba]
MSNSTQFTVDDSATQQGSQNKRLAFIDHMPTLRQYFQDTWLDILVVICAGALASPGVECGSECVDKTIPSCLPRGWGCSISGSFSAVVCIWVYRQDEKTFAYPRRSSIIPIWLDALLAILIPLLFFVIAQIRVRVLNFSSVYDLNTAFWGLIWAVLASTLFQASTFYLLDAVLLRLNRFLAVCNPDLSRIQGTGTGFQGIMYDISICSPDANKSHLRDATKSFPSGHTAAAAAGYVFLSLYFNAKMKIFSDERPHFYKLLVFLAPLLGVTLIGGVLTVDNSHHWYDVLAGGIIGITVALAAFRMSYASVWDYRFNHIPLPRPKSSWSPFTTQSKATEHPYASAANHFKYSTGVPSFPSFAHPRGWVAAGAPGDAWDANEMGRAEAEFRRQARMGA